MHESWRRLFNKISRCDKSMSQPPTGGLLAYMQLFHGGASGKIAGQRPFQVSKPARQA
jgi:hypothetical protein